MNNELSTPGAPDTFAYLSDGHEHRIAIGPETTVDVLKSQVRKLVLLQLAMNGLEDSNGNWEGNAEMLCSALDDVVFNLQELAWSLEEIRKEGAR